MNFKSISTRITALILIILLVGSGVQLVVTHININNIMESHSRETLTNAVNSKAQVTQKYIEKLQTVVDSFVHSSEISALIDNHDDPAIVAEAQAYAEKAGKGLQYFDSILFSSYECKCLVHSNKASVGYQSSEETIKFIQSTQFNDAKEPVHSVTAIVSPATGELSLVLALTAYNSQTKEPSGYGSLAVKAEEIEKIMSDVNFSSNQRVCLINFKGDYVYDTNTENMGKPSDITMVSDAIATYNSNNKALTGTATYKDGSTGKEMLGSYVIVPEYQWVFFISADTDTLYADARGFTLMIALVIIGTLVVMLILCWLIIRQTTKPIATVQSALSEVAALKLNVSERLARFQGRKDEVGRIAGATSQVVDTLNETVGVLTDCSNSLSSSSGALNANSRQLSEVTSDNSATTEELSASIDQTNSAIKTVTDEIGKIKELVQNIDEKVAIGESDSNALIDKSETMQASINEELDHNRETLERTIEVMEAALDSLAAVQKINEMADAIMDITSQTNLLSLNASIEAARAGEAGKGFAVVAGEIGQLAEQSKQTAMSIQDIVSASNAAVEDVNNNVRELIRYVQEDISQEFESFANQSREYGESVGTIRDAVMAIGDALETLTASVNEIGNGIEDVTQASEQNATGVQEIVNKNEETTGVTREISKLVEVSNENATNLSKVIGMFKTE
ncbi:MAG: methyl-accepting chemotaxis protein [Lachnospiraceae bacterium]|jgi:methyl-accepting chemotaxis protein|nr:methyl-accepting chemotaxis protein [Lachnospiraceae bacterium]